MSTPVDQATTLSDEERELWRARSGSDGEAQAALVDLYLPFARSIAADLYRKRIDDAVEFNEYFQYASLGLLEAIQRFDVERGLAFTTYATYRIRGSVLNGLERSTERREQLAYLRRQRQQRVRELADSGIDDAFGQVVELTINLALGFLIEDSNVAAEAEDPESPEELEAVDQLKQNIVSAIGNLPPRERVIIQYYYFHQTGFDQLADQLGVTKGRVSQLHKQALGRLRKAVSGRLLLDDYF